MKFKLQPYSIHELGQRQNQEDSMFPAYGKSTSSDRLFILCDGMGGHEKGEVASATVCETMSKCILSRWNPDEPLSDGLLLQAIEEAYDALDAKDNGEEKKMGTTMTFICFHGQGVTVAHIGDSRVYQLRPAKGNEPARIIFHTRDHSLVNDLIKIGEITEEEAKNHPQKNVITRAMQPCQERRAKADIAHLTDIQEGDYFYMCSDGMLEQTSDDNLLFIVTKPKTSDEQKVEMLREVTSENKDNHTAHLIRINKVERANVAPKQENAARLSAPKPQGTYVTPDEESNASSRKEISFYALIALFLIGVASGAGYYFLSPSETEEAPEEQPTEIVTPEETEDAEETRATEEAEYFETSVDEEELNTENAQPEKVEENDKENKPEPVPVKNDTSKVSNKKVTPPVDKFIPTKKDNPENSKKDSTRNTNEKVTKI